jgi:hypothetical protein
MSSPVQPSDGPPEFFDTAGKWLAARCQLTSRDRERVKTATRLGEPVSDPRLKEAVCGLASEILGNGLRLPGIAFSYAIGATTGVIGIVLLVIAPSTSGHPGRHPAPLIGLAVLAFISVPVYCLWHPWHARRNTEKALRVNSRSEE